MTGIGQLLAIRVVRDRAIEALSFGALCGAVVCAGIAGGVEAAGCVALLAARWSPGRVMGRYRELRCDGNGWTAVDADGVLVAVEPPVVHMAHRLAVVLQIVSSGRSDMLVFSASTTPAGDLRRLRVRLRAGGLSR